MTLLDELTLGSRKTFVRRVCTKLQMNRYSSSVFWPLWMGIIPSNSLTVLSGLGRYVHTDNRVSSSKRWISPEDVDIFKDEVKKKVRYQSTILFISYFPFVQPEAQTGPNASPPVSNTTDDTLPDADFDGEDVAWLNVTEIDELAQCVNTCVERWRNAGPEARKKMFALFAVAGIFLAVCRHGHVLVICDMIRSGEL